MTRQQALLEIMLLPDPLDLPPRRHFYTAPRRQVDKDPDEVKRLLGVAYIEHVRHEGRDISSATVKLRRAPLLEWRRQA